MCEYLSLFVTKSGMANAFVVYKIDGKTLAFVFSDTMSSRLRCPASSAFLHLFFDDYQIGPRAKD